MNTAVLAIDQGTSSSKAILVDPSGAVVARGSAPLAAAFPRPGWVEQDATALWESVERAVARCLDAAPDVTPVCVAISNQRESALVWRRADGTPVGPMIGWQDSRTAPACQALVEAGHADAIRARTGLAVDPMFSATKLRWLLERAPGGVDAAARGELCAATVDAWLVWQLTGGAVYACEAGNASRTQLMDLRTARWDHELLGLFGVPAAALPEIRGSAAGFGVTAGGGAIPAGLPITAILADSHAALFAHGCFTEGAGKATFGTGSSVMTPVAELRDTGGAVSQTLAWLTDRPTWALEGNIIASGSALDWMAETLGLAGGAALSALAAEAEATGGVHFVPAFAGLGAPYWDRDAVGLVDGLTRGTTRAQLALAALEAVAHQICDVLDAMAAASGHELEALHADGGASAGATLMQLQADLAGRPVLASTVAEMSALGAAHLGGVAAAVWDERALARLPRAQTTYRPRLDDAERTERRAGWRAAVTRARSRQHDPAQAGLEVRV